MALSDLAEAIPDRAERMVGVEKVMPVSPATTWAAINTAVNVADNAGGSVVNPGGITRSAIKKFRVAGLGTTLRLRLNYKSSALTTDPVVQVFGFDKNGSPVPLLDEDGFSETTLASATGDIDDGVDAFTFPKDFDCKGMQFVICTIKTAGAGGAAATAEIEAMVI